MDNIDSLEEAINDALDVLNDLILRAEIQGLDVLDEDDEEFILPQLIILEYDEEL